jgi:nicotinamidase-related amidase
MKKALITIDYTVDFVADEGALTCGEPAQEIEGRILQLSEEFKRNGDYVVLAVDTHKKGDVHHPETTRYPPHNIEGTKGIELYGGLLDFHSENQTDPSVYYMKKTLYSAFAGTDLEIRLRQRGIEELHLVGVCTDICVLHTAVDAYNRGFKMVIHQDAVASFDQDGHEWALRHFENSLGAEVRRHG